MNQYTDHIGHTISLGNVPQRIISLVPSQTELLIDLGLADRLVGRTKFCIHPSDIVKQVPIIGGTKKFNFEKINELKPDLIIGNKEENYQEGIESLQSDYSVWTSDIFDLKDSCHMIQEVGIMCGVQKSAEIMIDKIKEGWASIKNKYKGRILYFIWKKPYMVAGRGTFIDNVLNHLGFHNVVLQKRYPEIDEYVVKDYNPNCIFLSSEPFPFSDEHIREFEQLFPDVPISLVDGEMFSWYGSRLLKAVEYFSSLEIDMKSEIQ